MPVQARTPQVLLSDPLAMATDIAEPTAMAKVMGFTGWTLVRL